MRGCRGTGGGGGAGPAAPSVVCFLFLCRWCETAIASRKMCVDGVLIGARGCRGTGGGGGAGLDERWRLHNDSESRDISLRDVLRREAYILVYDRVDV